MADAQYVAIATLMEGLLPARPPSEGFAYIHSFHPPSNSMSRKVKGDKYKIINIRTINIVWYIYVQIKNRKLKHKDAT